MTVDRFECLSILAAKILLAACVQYLSPIFASIENPQ